MMSLFLSWLRRSAPDGPDPVEVIRTFVTVLGRLDRAGRVPPEDLQ
jgi:hypothetical protein